METQEKFLATITHNIGECLEWHKHIHTEDMTLRNVVKFQNLNYG